jgi:hypothetical protein
MAEHTLETGYHEINKRERGADGTVTWHPVGERYDLTPDGERAAYAEKARLERQDDEHGYLIRHRQPQLLRQRSTPGR